jgi:hypothetical protein
MHSFNVQAARAAHNFSPQVMSAHARLDSSGGPARAVLEIADPADRNSGAERPSESFLSVLVRALATWHT